MPEADGSIFNSKAAERLKSPDDLDKYVRVTNPSVWVMLAACLVLLAGLLVWGVFGTVSSGVKATATYVGGEVVSFVSVDDASKIKVGDSANVDGESMKVKSIASVPTSADEANGVLKSDYLVSSLVLSDWAYLVKYEGDASSFPAGVPLRVTITTENIAPLSLIFNQVG